MSLASPPYLGEPNLYWWSLCIMWGISSARMYCMCVVTVSVFCSQQGDFHCMAWKVVCSWHLTFFFTIIFSYTPSQPEFLARPCPAFLPCPCGPLGSEKMIVAQSLLYSETLDRHPHSWSVQLKIRCSPRHWIIPHEAWSVSYDFGIFCMLILTTFVLVIV